ncbi:hypothetical protein [Leucobacter luti]|uniref:Integral membrane protein n=1 Tax=Leucobacter luti TaxID=340320 RepID=A0A4Q7TKI9_9MICO|nr:hypothetical protein [Leucobacter luti]MBL3700341.1 hypothetical protein [Leucobacter luti]RZT60933.1 hypothetical protein EV139_2676 [Leucobacter luti]
MKRIDGRTLGRWSLRLDAIYCALLGAAVAVGAAPLSTVIALPHAVITSAGIVVVIWSGLVLWMLMKLRIRAALLTVLGVNILATALVAVSATAAGTFLAAIAVLAIAVDIAIFAASQVLALRALAPRPAA